MLNRLDNVLGARSAFEASGGRVANQLMLVKWREAEVREADWQAVALGTARAANEALLDFDVDLDFAAFDH